MHFDTPTLMMAGSITTALAGIVLLGVWTQMRHATALLWWCAANILGAIGIALLTIGLTDHIVPLIVSGSLTSDAALPLIWIGMRTFDQRPTPVLMALSVALGWMAADVVVGTLLGGLAFNFAGWTIWLSVSGFELWRGRSERLPARLPLIGLLLIHAFVYAGGVYDSLSGRFSLPAVAPLNSWFGAIFFEGIFFAMASAIAMVMLCKERETQEYMRAARSDLLTGIANHGALMESARRIFERCRKDARPYSLIMFDLDHFKTINDRHGHRTGDDILRSFTETVRTLLRPTDLFGRYGGEEFTVILPGANIQAAQAIAERVRHAFAESHRFLDGRPLEATVSAGVAEAAGDMSFEDTIDAADRAMYEAKRHGRNRIEAADRPAGTAAGDDSVVRIA